LEGGFQEPQQRFGLGDDFRGQELIFSIVGAKIGQWRQLPASIAQPPVAADPLKPRSMLAVTYRFKNDTSTKKLDLSKKFEFRLMDEFGNEYESLVAPADYPDPVFTAQRHFPSLYPQDSVTETIFFETPIERSRHLRLIWDARNVGIYPPIVFRIPARDIEKPPPDEVNIPGESDMKILYPPPGLTVKPLDVIPLKFHLAREFPKPDTVFIITPSYTFEDLEFVRYYDLRIPADQPPGAMIVVILLRWKIGETEQTLSKSITLNVIDPQEDCKQNCSRTWAKTGRNY
jgi:hypothetical protein